MKEALSKPIIIAGPCAAESTEQINASIQQINKRNIQIMRASLVKPRTKHGWDGIGLEEGIPMLKRIKNAGIIPATEVLDIDEAKQIVDGVLGNEDGKMMLWAGSRNQNHRFQRDLGSLAAHDSRLIIGAKNQPWRSEDHMRGIISHIADAGGADRENILFIMRGYSELNDQGFRNVPDYEAALQIKKDEGVNVLLDPSHIGGTRDKVIKVAKEGLTLARNGVIFDGAMIEVHPNIEDAKTDQKQQLTWKEYDEYILPIFEKGEELSSNAAD